MDRELERIYAALLAGYDVKNSNVLKQIQANLVLNQQTTLRPDASLCLLSLYDNMIVEPYSHRLRVGPPIFGVDQQGVPLSQQNFESRVMESFWLLLRTIDRDKKDVLASSHDVIIAINSAWGSISSYFNWG
jgi:hypothetical protein